MELTKGVDMSVPEIIESVLIGGDLAKLTADQRLAYYKKVCESLGLNTLTKPFEFISLNGKLTLYAKRDATDQLRKVHNVSLAIASREVIGDIYVVTAKATIGDRTDESTGAVSVKGLFGEALANAYLKSETKAKRRVTLSICGLGLLDETEVDSIPKQALSERSANVSLKQINAEIIVPELEVKKPVNHAEKIPGVLPKETTGPLTGTRFDQGVKQ